MAILKRSSFHRDTGKMDEESYRSYLKSARPLTESEILERERTEVFESKYHVKINPTLYGNTKG